MFMLSTILFPFWQSHWFTYNEKMSVESVTQAVSNLALQFGDDDAGIGAMVSIIVSVRGNGGGGHFHEVPLTLI